MRGSLLLSPPSSAAWRCGGAARMALSTSPPTRSRCFPFAEAPTASLDGYVGASDGFDPLGVSTKIDMRWLREAELKHGRVAMLAFVGFVAPDAGLVNLENGILAPSIAAHDASLGPYGGPLGQVWLFVATLEVLVGLPAVVFMLMGGDRAAGDFRFDPLGLHGITPEQRDEVPLATRASRARLRTACPAHAAFRSRRLTVLCGDARVVRWPTRSSSMGALRCLPLAAA
jgi:hypothetical protein